MLKFSKLQVRDAQNELQDISQSLAELHRRHNDKSKRDEHLHDTVLEHLSRAKKTMTEIHSRRKDSMSGLLF
jgi:ribosomal 50S subunit-associated protein YjgA (DUF615 family)